MYDLSCIVLLQTVTQELLSLHRSYILGFLSTTVDLKVNLILLENNSYGSNHAATLRRWLNTDTHPELNLRCEVPDNPNPRSAVFYAYIEGSFNMNRFYNMGASIAPIADYIMFSNSDLRFHENWFQKCMEVFNEKSDAGNVIPASSVGSFQHYRATKGGTSATGAFRIGSETDDIVEIIPPAGPGWMFLMPYEVWEKFKPWPDELPGWYQDWHAHDRIVELGYKSYCTHAATIDHLEGKTFKRLREADYHEYVRLTGPSNSRMYTELKRRGIK